MNKIKINKKQKRILFLMLISIILAILFIEIIFGDLRIKKEVQLGDIDTSLVVEEVVDNATQQSTQDSLGNLYFKKEFHSLGITIDVPKGWKIDGDSTNGVIYFKNEDLNSKYNDIEFCLKYTSIDDVGNTHLQKKFSDFLNLHYKYKNSIAVEKSNSQQNTIYDESKDVYSSSFLGKYYEYDQIPQIPEGAQSFPNFQKNKRFIGYYENPTILFTNNKNDLYTNIYYLISKNTTNTNMGVALITTGNKNNQIAIEEMSKKIAFSSQIKDNENTINDVKILPLQEVELNDGKTKISVPKSGILSNDPTDWSYGSSFFIKEYKKEDINLIDFTDNSLLAKDVFLNSIQKKVDVSNQLANKFYLTDLEMEKVFVGGTTGYLLDYKIEIDTQNKEVAQLVRNKMNFIPTKTLLLIDEDKVFAYSISSLPQGHLINDKYMKNILNTKK